MSSVAAATMSTALPSYEIGTELGRGGFGVVHAGRHLRLGRPVAIKTLVSHLAESDDVRQRFAVEARVLASLDHPHIVPVYDYVETDGVCLLVMESLPGGTVWDLFRTTGISSTTACGVAMVTCAALHHAHAHGVLHRDIKPENLLFTGDGQLKVTDFGIAKVVGGGDVLATSNGDILGTPAYMAPEQAEGGDDLGPPADVYATGVMLYEMLSGSLPFSSAGGGLAVVVRHMNEDPTPLRTVAPEVPQVLADVVMRAIARRVDQRYATAEEFGIALGAAVASVEGAGWLNRSDVKLVSGGPIASSSELLVGGSGPLSGTPYPSGPVPSGPWGGPGGAPVTPYPHPGSPGMVPSQPVAGPRTGPAPLVRPSEVLGHGRIPSARSGSGDLIRVRDVLDVPDPKRSRLLAAGGLVVVAAAVALLAPLGGHDGSDGQVAKGTVTLAGADVTGGSIRLDLGSPTPLVVGAKAAPSAASAQLAVTVGGIPVVTTPVEALVPTPDGRSRAAALDATGARLLLAGPATGQVRLLDRNGAVVAAESVTVTSGRSWASVPGALLLVALLALLAYAESLARPVWRNGKVSWASRIGLIALAAAAGALLVPFAWLAGATEPHPAVLVVCAALTGVAGWLGLDRLIASGRRRRIARLRENANLGEAVRSSR